MRDFDVTGSGFGRWVGIIGKGATAPEKGLYLIAKVSRGQGFDIDYDVLELEQGDQFDNGSPASPHLIPIAYHLIPDDQWIQTNLVIHKGDGACNTAPISGVAVISLLDARTQNRSKVTYHLNMVGKYQDITTVLKWKDLAGPTCFSDEYDGFTIQGFHMAFFYDADVCREHVMLRLKNEPGLFRE